jgi:hypothetical protein
LLSSEKRRNHIKTSHKSTEDTLIGCIRRKPA